MGKLGTNKNCHDPIHGGRLRIPPPLFLLPVGSRCTNVPQALGCSILLHPREGPEITPMPPPLLHGYRKATYVESAFFSEKTRRQKSPFLLGSKVEGTMIYSPAGSLNRLRTSRRLIKVFDLSLALLVRKKFLLRWIFVWPENLWKAKNEKKNPTVCMYLHLQIKNIIDMTIRYVWRKNKNKKSVQQNQKREEKGGGYVPPQHPWAAAANTLCRSSQEIIQGHAYVLQMMNGVWRHLADSSTNCFSLKRAGLWPASLWSPELVPPGDHSSALPPRSGCLTAESPRTEASKNKIHITHFKSIFGV